MKYLIAAICAAAMLAALAFVGAGYLDTRRADRRHADLRASVHAMTLQDLAAAVARCDAPLPAEEAAPGARRRDTARRDAAFCAAVARELDDRPLEIVKVKPADVPAPR